MNVSFYEWQTYFPFLSTQLLDHVNEIQDELHTLKNVKWNDWPETNLYMKDKGQTWRVIPFCYTFPSNTGKTNWVESSSNLFPKTVQILKSIPGLKTALFSKMGPSTSLLPHDGWKEISNYVLRCHLALDIPGNNISGVAVGNKVKFHTQNEILCFDDAKIHSGFNLHTEKERTVLIFDVERPFGIAQGNAKGGATLELQNFMDYFS